MIAALHSTVDEFTGYSVRDGVFAEALFDMR